MSDPLDDKPSVSVAVDADAKIMRLSFSREMTADIGVDVIRSENRNDPVEAGRQIWHLVAPTLRELGWTDERIVKTYRIPEEVLSGEADRRAGVRFAEYRLTWIEREPDKLWDGEGEMIARLRAGEISVEDYAAAIPAMLEKRRREIDGDEQ